MAGFTWLDDYERTARLAPGLLALLPVPILVSAFGLKHNPVIAILISALIAVGGPLVLAKYVRSRGRKLEQDLYRKWGGPPTTLLLTRPTANDKSDPLREQRRKDVQQVYGKPLPKTPLPHDASTSQTFTAAVKTIIQRTYDRSSYPLVYAENKSYGYERNARGIRSEAIIINAAGVICGGIGSWLSARGDINANTDALAAATIVIIGALIWWIAWPTEERVRQAADLYAAQLLDAATRLTSN